jgi:hypothetical protein
MVRGGDKIVFVRENSLSQKHPSHDSGKFPFDAL